MKFYDILMDYSVSNTKSAYAILSIENKNLEIEITKSVVSNSCFISITVNNELIVENKICTVNEPIIKNSRCQSVNALSGDFVFNYTDPAMRNYDFDINYLGSKLLLSYISEV